MSKKIVCYFSASGVTKEIAEKISKSVSGDLFEIEPEEKYTVADLDWSSKVSRTTKEMQDTDFRPPIKEKISNINEYDTVILGFPVWWFTAPTIINTFIEENDLSDKNIYIFATSAGSPIDKSVSDLRKKYTNLNIISGKRFTGSETDNEINEWIK